MGDVLIVGYGSDLRRDDAAGRRVADEIERRSLPDVRVRTSVQLLPELVDDLVDAERVVFVDASVEVDEVTVSRLRPCADVARTHHATPEQLLGLATVLSGRAPSAFLVQVPARDLSLGEGLSADTAGAVERAVAATTELVRLDDHRCGPA